MKKMIVVLALLVCVAFQASAQRSKYYMSVVSDTTAATSAWDSVYLGGSSMKLVKVTTFATNGTLFFALEDDTTAGKIVPIRPRVATIAPETYEVVTYARWLRRKASTGTIQNRVTASQVPVQQGFR